MPTNFYMYFLIALIPMVIGATYYHPKLLGAAWMKSNGFTMESLEGGNMALIMGGAYLLSFILVFGMTSTVIHQFSLAGLMMPEIAEQGSAVQQEFSELMDKYGSRHRNFGHGALHGFASSLLFALPIIGIISSFERRGWKYVLIHFGYWAITLMLVGGALCSTLKFAQM